MNLPHAHPASYPEHAIIDLQERREMARHRYDHARMRLRTTLILVGLPFACLLLLFELLVGATLLVLPTCLIISVAIAA